MKARSTVLRGRWSGVNVRERARARTKWEPARTRRTGILAAPLPPSSSMDRPHPRPSVAAASACTGRGVRRARAASSRGRQVRSPSCGFGGRGGWFVFEALRRRCEGILQSLVTIRVAKRSQPPSRPDRPGVPVRRPGVVRVTRTPRPASRRDETSRPGRRPGDADAASGTRTTSSGTRTRRPGTRTRRPGPSGSASGRDAGTAPGRLPQAVPPEYKVFTHIAECASTSSFE